MIHVRFSKIIEIVVIAIILLTTLTIAPIKATRDFSGEANIHAVNSVGTFTSETSPVRYSVDPSTKKGYYFIGSAYKEFENTTTDESTVIQGAGILIRSTSDITNATPTVKVEQYNSSVNINKTISRAYLELSALINDFCEIEPPGSSVGVNKSITDAYIELLTLINEKAKLSPVTANNHPGTNEKFEETKYYDPSRSPPSVPSSTKTIIGAADKIGTMIGAEQNNE